MSSWSSNRKSVYALIMLVIVLVLVVVPAYYFFYTPPSCTDRVKNGTELGIDCGGSCTKLCSSSFLPIPSPSWVRLREIAPNIYNVAAYIVNPNSKVGAKLVPFEIELIDASGFTLVKTSGSVNVPAGRNTLAFVSIKNTASKPPVRAVFKFVGEPNWVLSSNQPYLLEVTDKNYSEDQGGSSLEVTLNNKAAIPVKNIIVYAVLQDADNNVIDFSKTILDEIPALGKAIAPFTWPISHNGAVISIEVLPVAE